MKHKAWYKTIPGDLKWPIIGNTLQFYFNFLNSVKYSHERFGPVFKWHILGQTGVAFIGPEANRLVLVEAADQFSSKLGWDLIGRLFQNGLMLRDGLDHRHHRRILQTAFHRSVLMSYFKEIEKICEQYLGFWNSNPPYKLYPAVKQLMLDLAARVFLGLELEEEIESINKAFLKVVKGATAFVRWPVPGLDLWQGLQARYWLSTFFLKLIDARRQNLGQDLLGRLIAAKSEDGKQLSDQEIVDHLIFFMMAAHDTTTSTVCSLLYELGKHTHWQQRLRKQSLELDCQNPFSFEKLSELEELDWAIKETLRLHPPIVVIPRETLAPITFQGFHIPKGVTVGISPAVTQRLDQYWTNPEDFDPERFSKKRAEDKQTPYVYLPFGSGPHTCLGMSFAQMQVKLLMHKMLCKFQWDTPPGYKASYQQVPIQVPSDGLPIRLQSVIH